MKILLVYYEPQPSGQTTHLLSLARSLDPRRYGLTIVLPEHLTAATLAFQQVGARVVPLPLRKVLWSPRAITTLIRLVRDGQPDIVHVHSQEAGLIARPLAHLAGAPTILYTPQCIDIRRARWRRLYARLERALARFTGAIISVNDADRQRLIRWGIPAHKVVTIPNGIDLDDFEGPVDAGELHQLLGLRTDITPEERVSDDESIPRSCQTTAPRSCQTTASRSCRTTVRQKPAQTKDTSEPPQPVHQPGSPLVIQVGRLSAQKDPMTFVEGAARVLRAHPQAQFALLGDGPLRDDVGERIRELGLDRHIHLLGWHPGASQLMAAASVVTLTSRWEGAPYGLLEAMACSRPVVATSVNGCPEIVVDSQTGYLVPPGDPDAWATAVSTLLNDPAQAAAMGRRGRKRVAEHFTLPQMIARIESVYEQTSRKNA